MIQVQPPDSFLQKILGQQEMTRGVDYRLLSFCISLPVPEGVLICNNFTKEVLFFPESEPASSPHLLEILVRKWFYVPTSMNDRELFNQTLSIAKMSDRRKDKSFTILTTTACNARCFYCFEKGTPAYDMSVETARDVVAYIRSLYQEGSFIRLHWFGGEPLCNPKAIDIICSELKASGIPFSSKMTTNGFLLSEDMAAKAAGQWNLQSVQITLDGTEDIYNRAKAYIYPSTNAYQKVMSNLSHLKENGVSLSIRLNADMYNVNNLHELVDELGKLFPDPSSVYIGIAPLMEHAGAFPIVRDEEARTGLFTSLKELSDHIESLGFATGRGLFKTIRTGCCEADSPHAIVIMPDGSLRRCQHIKAGSIVGSVKDMNPSLGVGLWTSYREPLSECDLCPFYPTCFRLTDCEESVSCSSALRSWKLEQFYTVLRRMWKNFRQNCSTIIENS